MTSLDLDLSALEALHAAATPGEWNWDGQHDVSTMPARVGSTKTNEWFAFVHPHHGGQAYRDGWVEPWVPGKMAEADAACIAALHNAAPELLRRARLLDEAREVLTMMLHYDCDSDGCGIEEHDKARALLARIDKEET